MKLAQNELFNPTVLKSNEKFDDHSLFSDEIDYNGRLRKSINLQHFMVYEKMNSSQVNLEMTLTVATQLRVKDSIQFLRQKQFTVGFAESCTGGLLSSFFTEIAGVSDVFMGSVVSYANQVKKELLDVSAEALTQFGAVSREVARQMSEGALQKLNTSVAVSITGIAGPGGGSDLKPLGTVFIAVAGLKSETKVFEHHFDGNRKTIQLLACEEAVKHLNEFLI